MANIAISDIDTAGLDLFVDSEGFMSELTEEELTANYGGFTPAVASSHLCAGIAVAAVAGAAGYLYGRFG